MRNRYPSTLDFQMLFEAAPGLYLVLLPNAPHYTIVAVSDAYARANMIEREEILERGFFEVFPDDPDDADDPTGTGATELRESLGRVLTKGIPDEIAVQKYGVRGAAQSEKVERRWWSAKNCPVTGSRGEIAYIIHAVEEVTEKRRLEEERQLFAALVENSSDFIGIADPGGKPLYVNPAGRRMVGLSPDHPVGETQLSEYYPPEERAFASDVIVKQAAEHGHWAGETHFRNWKTGEAIPVSDEHFLIRGPGGRVLGMGAIARNISEAQRAAAEREQLLTMARNLFDQASDSIFIADLNGRFTEVNANACKMLGYGREELIGKTIADIIPPEDVPRLTAAREYLRTPGAIQVADWTQIRKDGTPIPVEVSARILPDGRWQAFVRDISGRKRIEEELKAANVFLDAIIENIPLMLFIKESKSLRFVRFNRAAEELLGWTRETSIGRSDYDVLPPAQADFFIQKDRETLKDGQIVDIPEEPIQTRHQGIRLLHTKKVPILDPTGNPIYLLGISEDITERKQIEKEQRFLAEVSVTLSTSLDYEQTVATVARLVVQNIADWCAVDLLEEDGRIRRLKVASADPAKAELCAVLEQMPPNRDRPHLMRSVIEGGKPVVVEHVTPQFMESFAQGREHLEALLATGITSFIAVPLSMRGQALGGLLFGSSTPSRVFGQNDLRLAEAVAERAAMAVENARLYRASVSATQLRDQVLGIVAHDLRNPLSTILMQVLMLRRKGAEPDRRSQKPTEVIHRAATRMNRLIQDLLDVALMEAGRMTIEPERLSAGGLVVEAVDMQRPLASSSSLELRTDLRGDLPTVWADRDRLLQVFENLIGNAIKFTKADGRITVGAEARDTEVMFWVTDTGSGIAAENLPRVFDRFWQATRAGRHGAGLGLPIAKGIVEAHGGRIWVESTEHQGTTLSFTIPRAFPAQDRPSFMRTFNPENTVDEITRETPEPIEGI